jgi:predicted enzyme involved in methoxymalonyl-ACP biosynthesis
MTAVYGPFTAVDHARVVQLINKTNQFNTTTRRYAGYEVSEIMDDPASLTLHFRLLDRVGDNGLVSTMILRPARGGDDALEIENWVMSCRVFGRGLEFEAMNIAVDAARERGVRGLVADYIPTPKNDVISKLYPRLGFVEVDRPAPANGARRFRLDLADYVTRNTHIVLQEQQDDQSRDTRQIHPHSSRSAARRLDSVDDGNPA